MIDGPDHDASDDTDHGANYGARSTARKVPMPVRILITTPVRVPTTVPVMALTTVAMTVFVKKPVPLVVV